MSNPGESTRNPTGYSFHVNRNTDPRVPLLNLSTVCTRMDSLKQFLSESVNNNTLISKDQMDMVSSEISSAINQIIVNAAALLSSSSSSSQPFVPQPPVESTAIKKAQVLKVENREENEEELDAVELLAEHVHFCDICGKGFKIDANLRMHMRAHRNQFKTLEALAKPDKGDKTISASLAGKTNFSCPFEGCNRNKKHSKFKPLMSVICVRNHFKRSHCPKMYSCNRCHKSFSVLADLKSHLKHCGESRWKCSFGTSFSRKDKLFGRMALFEGHMPAVVGEEAESKAKGLVVGGAVALEEDDEEEESVVKGDDLVDNEFFEGLPFGFGSMEGYNLQDVWGLL
ncbi:PREDICTED: protein SENSITIVE TO PROTON RHIZOTOXICITY 1-like [Populus euphratica]|uniref:Protein SENSITIVE TO PROTON RHIZOTOXICITY 1-like n=1 Tax=Populus euphratica TaxID=75702 RepID=A0AAJ6UKX8_POPEU|nr:PREDICTED: protein SENSITIVE TO PROTON RHIZOTOXICITY 1-like [Populus euphratica]